jgi:hypothetical protein
MRFAACCLLVLLFASAADARAIADSGVPLQLYWSSGDRVIRDQRLEIGELALELIRGRPEEKVWDFDGQWAHTAEMRATARLPRALARFGLLPWSDVPALPVRPAPELNA